MGDCTRDSDRTAASWWNGETSGRARPWWCHIAATCTPEARSRSARSATPHPPSRDR